MIVYILQGSVSTQLRYGEESEDFNANSLLNSTVKEFWKSVNIGIVMNEKYRWSFFDSQCIFLDVTKTSKPAAYDICFDNVTRCSSQFQNWAILHPTNKQGTLYDHIQFDCSNTGSNTLTQDSSQQNARPSANSR